MKSYLGFGSKHLIDHSSNFNVDSDKILKVYTKRYLKKYSVKTRPYDDIYELLQSLKQRGYKLGVISNKENNLVSKIVTKHFPSLFDYSLGEVDFLLAKPNKDMLEFGMIKLETTSSNALYIGDSEVDISFAKNANVDVVAVTWGFRDKDFLIDKNPNFIIDEPFELLEILRIYNGGI